MKLVRPSRLPSVRRQRGVAALVVVLVLFFVVSLVAAYTSRNLIFEQRTGINQYRSTQALEAAEAGLEWAVAMLNAGRIDTACRPSAVDNSFRARYLSIDSVTGVIATTGTGVIPPLPTCVLGDDGRTWDCTCPQGATTSPAVPTAPGPHPAFRLGFAPTTRPGVVRIVVAGCTVLDPNCLAFGTGPSGLVTQSVAPGNEGTASISAHLALTGNLPAVERDPTTKEILAVLPRDAVAAQGDITAVGAGTLTVTRAGTGPGFALRAGGTLPAAGVTAVGPPGTPGSTMLYAGDGALAALDTDAVGAAAGERMFASIFNVLPKTFETQPAIVRLDCPTACSAATLKSSVDANPGLPVWVQGDLDLDTNLEIGSTLSPVLVVVTGNVAFSAATARINGLLYGRATDWTIGGTPTIRGAVVAENNLILNVSGGAITHDPDLLRRLNTLTGSFVRVPGAWKDFP